MPPHSREAERCVLGSMLRDNAVIGDVLGRLRADHFYADAHRKIFDAVVALYNRGTPADVVTLAELLKERHQIEDVGGYGYIGGLWDAAPTAANAEYYAQIVRDKSIVRNLIHAATEILREAYNQAMPADELLESAEKKLLAVADVNSGWDTVRHDELIDPAFVRFDQRQQGRTVAAVRTGLVDLDDLTAGLHDSELIVIAARPSIGKTALALWIAKQVCIEDGLPVLFVSLEQSREELIDRLPCAEAGLDSYRLRHARPNPSEADALVTAGQTLKEAAARAAIYIDDTPGQNMVRVAANARRLKLRHGIRLIVVDYLQLVAPEKPRENRQEQVAGVSRRLKGLARELNVPVVALAQLNRNAEERADRRPQLSDLRDSGQIEQDADVVCLLWHPQASDEDQPRATVECLVRKQRNGPRGTAQVIFDKARGQFENFAPACPSPPPGS
jgi:replicative DNA helicase